MLPSLVPSAWRWRPTFTLAHICPDVPSGSACSPLMNTNLNGRSGLPAPAALIAFAASMVYVYTISVYASSDMPRALLPRAQISASCSASPFASSGEYVLKSVWMIVSVFSVAFAGSSAHAGIARRVRRVTRWMEGSLSAAR